MFKPSIEARALEPLADLFKLLSDDTRLRILGMLSQGERNVTSLCRELRLPQPTVSHHLGLLRSQNLIVNRREGKQVFYGLDGHVSVLPSDGVSIRFGGYELRISRAADL
jgi:ArsR family transcriptional regulator, zinc-responsive transcriptional repressor